MKIQLDKRLLIGYQLKTVQKQQQKKLSSAQVPTSFTGAANVGGNRTVRADHAAARSRLPQDLRTENERFGTECKTRVDRTNNDNKSIKLSIVEEQIRSYAKDRQFALLKSLPDTGSRGHKKTRRGGRRGNKNKQH